MKFYRFAIEDSEPVNQSFITYRIKPLGYGRTIRMVIFFFYFFTISIYWRKPLRKI